jgi:phospholipid transport system substrate-binding protein
MPMGVEAGLRGLRVGFLAGLLALVGAWAALAAGGGEGDAPTAGPRALVQETVDRVLEILDDPDLDDDQRRTRIEALAFSVFDFKTVSRLVMARNWKKLDKAQRADFGEEFKQYLARNYGQRLERYEKAEVEVLGARPEPRGDATVLTRVVGAQYDGISMNYRLRFRAQKWQVIDIVIEGVSMLANFRAQFAEVVSREGVDGLLAAMRARNLDADPSD